ncbi:unnamed protein product, partial [Mesorhabditis belari]|uniref:C3H1-type domain-containing protein n=1 Tax=Mesorhabditis belari TaxID=2138241 RepID=A0AAF3FF86_9BILA
MSQSGMLCEGWISQDLFRRLQNEHRFKQQHPRASEGSLKGTMDFRFATGSNGTSSREDDFSLSSSSSERSSNDYKISLCAEFMATRKCRFGGACRYAHAYDELRLAKPRGKCNPKYKTRYCDKFSNTGFCKYGDRCQYIHHLLNDTIREDRKRRGVAMNINERPLESNGTLARQMRYDGGLNATVDARMNVTVDERMNVTVDGFAGRIEKHTNVHEKWTPFSKQFWGFKIEEQLNTSLPVLRPSFDPVSIEASLNGLLSDESQR